MARFAGFEIRSGSFPTLVIAGCLLAFIISLQADAHAQMGARTVGRGLEQLTQEAGTIVHGGIISTKVEPQPQLHNLMTLVVTMNVKDTYKGAPAKTLTFRQYVCGLD